MASYQEIYDRAAAVADEKFEEGEPFKSADIADVVGYPAGTISQAVNEVEGPEIVVEDRERGGAMILKYVGEEGGSWRSGLERTAERYDIDINDVSRLNEELREVYDSLLAELGERGEMASSDIYRHLDQHPRLKSRGLRKKSAIVGEITSTLLDLVGNLEKEFEDGTEYYRLEEPSGG